MTAYCRKW